MKKAYILIGVAAFLLGVSIFNFTLDIDNKGHYFGNGIICGVGLSIVVVQLLKLRRMRHGN